MIRAGEMAYREEELAANSDDLSSIPGSSMVERTDYYYLYSDLHTHGHTHTSVHTGMCAQTQARGHTHIYTVTLQQIKNNLENKKNADEQN